MKGKKILVLSVVVLLVMLTSCSKKSETNEVKLDEEALKNVNEEGMPIVENPITLDIFARKDPASNDNWNDVMIFNEYEKRSNIKVNWEMVPHDSLEEKRNLTLASGNLPDAFHSTFMPSSDILKYGQQGVFIPLNDLIDKYAPNFKKILKENPEVKKALTFPDGNIYSFPTMAEPNFLSYRTAPKPWINEAWLDTLDMDMPETTDDFYDYLQAVKDQDPNGNGEADEIPLGAPNINTIYSYLRGSFGIANKGLTNENIDLEPGTDNLRFYPIADEYEELLKYIHKLYSEGLIEKNIFSIEMDQYLANATEGKYGSTVWYSPEHVFGEDAGDKFTGMTALEGPKGDKLYTTVNPIANNIGAFLITNENEHPAATMRWVDYFYGDEGEELFFMGVAGETYEENDNGELEFMDHILNSKDGLTVPQEQAKYLTFPGGGYPSIITQKYFTGAESSPKAIEAADTLEPNIVDKPWAAFIYTKEENDKLSGFGHDIDKYVAEMRDKFISGDASFDEWDKYVKTLKDMNLEGYMDIKTEAYERYENN